MWIFSYIYFLIWNVCWYKIYILFSFLLFFIEKYPFFVLLSHLILSWRFKKLHVYFSQFLFLSIYFCRFFSSEFISCSQQIRNALPTQHPCNYTPVFVLDTKSDFHFAICRFFFCLPQKANIIWHFRSEEHIHIYAGINKQTCNNKKSTPKKINNILLCKACDKCVVTLRWVEGLNFF